MNRGLNKLLATKWGKIFLTIILIAYIGYDKLYNEGKQNRNHTPRATSTLPGVQPSLEGQNLIYTAHAKCRMGCRNISRDEVEYVRDSGKVNQRKSDPYSRPCPTQSREARSSDGQLIRVVFANCQQKTKVVTVIDLENKYQCSCR